MKTLIINTTNDIGSTGKLAYSLYCYLNNKQDQSTIISGQGTKNKSQRQFVVSNVFLHKIDVFLSRLTGLHGFFSLLSTFKAIRIIKKQCPDVIYLGNLHGNYINIYLLFSFLAKRRIPCVHLMWDEYALGGGCVYSFGCEKFKTECKKCKLKKQYPKSYFFDQSKLIQMMNKKYFNLMNICFVGVEYTIVRCRQSSSLKGKRMFILDESVDQENFYYPRHNSDLRSKLGIPEDAVVCLDVCFFTNERKGGKIFLDIAKRCQDLNSIYFIHVGYNGNEKDLPSNFIPISFVEDRNLMAEFYSISDLYVCTSFEDTQPNACLESLSCGTKICGFNISGIPYTAVYPFGEYVNAGDIDSLVRIIKKTTKKTSSEIEKTRNYAVSRFSSKNYNYRLYEIGKMIMKGN